MGSLISLELINIELQFISEPDNYNWLNWNLLAIVLPIFAIILILIICLVKQHHPKRNTQRWTPPPTLLVILLFILIALVSDTNSFPGRKYPLFKKPPLFKRLGKPIAKGTIPILATSAVYLGFESFAQFLTEHPDISVADKSKISLKDNRSQQAETTDSTMECDPPPTTGIATTETSAPPPTKETTPTHPRVQPPSPPAAAPETTDDEPAAVDIPLPDGPAPLAALKLPQRLKIASRVHFNPTYIHNLLTPPPPPNFMPNLKNTPAPSIRSLCSPSIVSAPVPTYIPNPQILFVAVPILTPATPLLPSQFLNVQPFAGPGVSRP
uniref:Uncharacterized protein n=1 Tax=Meloidogyne floridensis TaxID=298350 RepID=A0A915NR35_9BILA